MRTPNETIKEEILKCASSHFSDKGYAAVNLADISKELNISRAPLYYYFSNKAELYSATIDYEIECQRTAYQKIFSTEQSLEEVLRNDMIYCLSLNELFSRISTGGKDEPDVSEKFNEFRNWLLDLKLTTLSYFQNKGDIPETTNIADIVTFIFVYYNGIKQTRRQASLLPSLNHDILNDGVELFMEIIKKQYLNK